METKILCPCEGIRGRTWHRTRGIKPCAYIAKQRASEEVRYGRKNSPPRPRNKHKGFLAGWVPGSSIYLDENDPL